LPTCNICCCGQKQRSVAPSIPVATIHHLCYLRCRLPTLTTCCCGPRLRSDAPSRRAAR
jgi:hypothetical protein